MGEDQHVCGKYMSTNMANFAEDDAFRGSTGISKYTPIEFFSEGLKNVAAHISTSTVSGAMRTHVYMHLRVRRGYIYRVHRRICGMLPEHFGYFIHVRQR